MPIARRPVLAAGFGLLLGSGRAGAADVIVGSGPATTQRREVGAFSAVALGAPFSVLLRPGAREAIEVTADENLLALIETRVRGSGSDRSLEIGVARHVQLRPRTPVMLTVDFVRLDAIALGGSGTISGKALKSPRLGATIGGSGTIALSEVEVDVFEAALGGSGVMRADGHARKLSVDIGGSGRCDLERLIASDVSVSVAGTGETRVHADAALSVAVAGSGNVYYAGAATPRVSSVGSGRVVRL